MAIKYRDTPMMGRTLGQQALPITFGKKVGTWIAENRRNIERLKQLLFRVDRMTILKGAVGSYNGLGEQAIELEKIYSEKLGFPTSDPSDWHGVRDTVAEYGFTLALIGKGFQRIGNEIFLLQMTELDEVNEKVGKDVVGSSTMPHKSNPKKVTSMQFDGTYIAGLSQVLLDDVVNFFERDNTDQVNKVVGEISIAGWKMMHNTYIVLNDLQVHPENMLNNMYKTNGFIMSQRIAFYMGKKIGKTTANELMHHVVAEAVQKKISLKEAMQQNPQTRQLLTEKEMDELLNPTTYMGLDGKQLDLIIMETKQLRKTDPQ